MKGPKYIRALVQKMLDDDCPGLAAQMSYHFILSFVPVFILLITLLGLIGSNPDILLEIFSFLQRLLPPSALQLVRDLLTKIIAGKSGGLAVISTLVALWAGSNGAIAVIKALNRAYGFSDNERKLSFWHERLIAVMVVMMMGLTLFLAANAIVLGELLLSYLEYIAILDRFEILIASFLRWIAAIVLLSIFSSYIYATVPGPVRNAYPVKKVLPGATTFVLLWLGCSLIFSHYIASMGIASMGPYNEIYDSLGGVIILMIWFYLTSLAFLTGAEISAISCLEANSKT